MQARASEQQHDDEHRVLSSSTNSSTTDETSRFQISALDLDAILILSVDLQRTRSHVEMLKALGPRTDEPL